jgi:type II secretory pathway component PulK
MTAWPRRAVRSQSGIVLVMVLFFVLLLASAMASFLRRVAVDAAIATNRDRAQQAESLARGGVRLAEAILLEDLRTKGEQGGPDSRHDLWARAGELDLVEDPDVDLRVHIEDAGARINLNGFLAKGVVDEKGRLYLQQLLAGVIAIMPGRPEELLYDPLELSSNLVDWIDSDEVTANGAPEDELYQRRNPPYRAPNRPLLSVDELRLVAGFDGRLVDALKPFVGVYPLAGGGGVNLNTAPEWVLIQLQRGSEVSGPRGLEEKDVRRIADVREDGTICGGDAQAPGCTSLADLLKGDTIERAATERSKVFVVTAVARVVDIERRIETVIDRTAKGWPRRLSWSVQ